MVYVKAESGRVLEGWGWRDKIGLREAWVGGLGSSVIRFCNRDQEGGVGEGGREKDT